MKKITLISACMLLFTAVSAEQMQFVTTMSAPVGNFAHLDAADSTHVTTAPILNFCNTRSNVGNIVIKGANAYLKQVNVQNGTTLGSTNTPEYRLSEKLTIENGGAVTAGRIMANNVTFKDTNFHQSNVTNTIYGNDIAVMGGKTDNMDISSTAKINKSAQNSANLGEELWWDNQYASDYDASGNKKANGKTYTSFLLKSKSAGTGTCEDDTYKAGHKSECCPSMPTSDDVCYKDCAGQKNTTYEWTALKNYWEVDFGIADVCTPTSRRDDVPLSLPNLQAGSTLQNSFRPVEYFASRGLTLLLATSREEFVELCNERFSCSKNNVDDMCYGLLLKGSVTCFSADSGYREITGWINPPGEALTASCWPTEEDGEPTRCKNGW